MTVPAGVAFLVLAAPIADAVTFGRMATGGGPTLVALSLAPLGPAVIGSAALLLAMYACYARDNASAPLRAVLIRAAVTVAGMAVAFGLPSGPAALVTIGLTISVAELAGGWWLAARLRRELPRRGDRLSRALLRTAAASVLMAGPAYLLADRLPVLLPVGGHLTIVVTAAAGAAVFLLVQAWWRAPELALLAAGVRQLRTRTGRRGDAALPRAGQRGDAAS